MYLCTKSRLSANFNHVQSVVCVWVGAFRNHQSSIGHVFLIHEPKLQMYEQYIKASRRSAMTMETWRKKDPDFNTLITIFQVFVEASFRGSRYQTK